MTTPSFCEICLDEQRNVWIVVDPERVRHEFDAQELTEFYLADAALDQEDAVVTGWIFPNGRATTPTDQYCYLHEPARNGVSEEINLAANGNKLVVHITSLVALSSRCQWFTGGKV